MCFVAVHVYVLSLLITDTICRLPRINNTTASTILNTSLLLLQPQPTSTLYLPLPSSLSPYSHPFTIPSVSPLCIVPLVYVLLSLLHFFRFASISLYLFSMCLLLWVTHTYAYATAVLCYAVPIGFSFHSPSLVPFLSFSARRQPSCSSLSLLFTSI